MNFMYIFSPVLFSLEYGFGTIICSIFKKGGNFPSSVKEVIRDCDLFSARFLGIRTIRLDLIHKMYKMLQIYSKFCIIEESIFRIKFCADKFSKDLIQCSY